MAGKKKIKFIHLHVHTEYSLLDGLPKIKKLVRRAKELGMGALAITDHGTMYGAVEFYKACKDVEIKPIIGMEAYTTNKDHKLKEGKEARENHHLLLLAKNEVGYKNLMKITTIAHLEGYYYRPRINKEVLKKYSEGLICASACPQGEIAQTIINGDYEKARRTAKWFLEVFGEDYYLELQRHNHKNYLQKVTEEAIRTEIEEQAENERKINEAVVKLSRELGIPLVATNDSHYIEKGDAVAQDVLVCVATGKNVSDTNRLRFIDIPDFYLKPPEEMAEQFADYPEAIENTVKIADKCNLEIKLGEWYFPKIDLPGKKSAEEHLRERAKKLLPERLDKVTKETRERLNYELNIICGKGYASYFVLMAEFTEYAKKHGIITNTRGSAAGSLISYVLGITTVNPLRYQLPFERFLNPDRPKPPDIDLDIADDRREELIQYIVDKYGSDKVAQICTFGRMLARGSVRDVARVLGYPYATGDRIAKLIPMGAQGFPMTIRRALNENQDLKALYDTDRDARRVIDLAQQVEGNARHVSVHAAGLVISPDGMTNLSPLQREPGGEKVITQYEMHACEDVGLIKFDLLGIRNLSILGSAIDLVAKNRGEKVDLRQIPLDDPKTFEMLARGETMGVFQLSGSGMTRYLKELKPTRIEDIMVMIALFRPGPMANIPSFIRRKHAQEKVSYPHPKLKEILEKSYGVVTYQEDVMLIAIEIAGYTWKTVDALRNAIGKKIPEEMAKQEKIFKEGARKHGGLTSEEANRLWDLFTPFQGYGFNKAHAASYGIVAYQTAYMKANYPVKYMCALLTAESNDTDKVAAGVAEARRMGINVFSPDVNKSGTHFEIEKDATSREKQAILFGLSAIKNVGVAAIESILKAREEGGKFKSLTDFCQKVDGQKVNKRVLESLIKAGAMDAFGKRSALLAGLDDIRTRCISRSREASSGQTGLFDTTEGETSSAPVDNLPTMDEFSKDELLSFEKQFLGFYLSDHPLSNVINKLRDKTTHKLSELSSEEHVGQKVKIGGIVQVVRVVTTKQGNREMAFVTLEDDVGTLELIVFPNVYSKTRDFWSGNQPLVIGGKVEYREDSLSVIVESVQSIEESESISDSAASEDIILRIPRGTDSKILVALNQLLQSNKGDRALTILVENGFGEKRIKLPYGVAWSQSLQENIQKLFSR